MTRNRLEMYEDQRLRFKAVFECQGVNPLETTLEQRFLYGDISAIIVLSDLQIAEGCWLVADQVWLSGTKNFEALNLQPGDVVEFNARVKRIVTSEKWDFIAGDWIALSWVYVLRRPAKIEIVGRDKNREDSSSG